MMGSVAIGGLIAHVAFWILLVRGYFSEALGVRGCAIAVGLWLLGYFAAGHIPYAPPIPTWVAILDIGLVFVVVKGDVRLT